MKPIVNWKQGWRMFSVQAMTLAGALQGAWVALPPALASVVPPWAVNAITIGLLVAGILGRLVAQPGITKP